MEHVRLSEQEKAEPVDNVYLAALSAGEKTSMQAFEVEPGAVVPEHEHPHEQTGFVYEGELTLRCDGETTILREGDSFTIPGGEPHGVENHSDSIARGIDIFSPPRTDPDWGE